MPIMQRAGRAGPASSPDADDASALRALAHALPALRVAESLHSSADGLRTEEACARLTRTGPNTLPRKRARGARELVFGQLNNPLIWVLTGSAALAMALGKMVDGAVVLAVVVINASIGFFQEYRAHSAIEALRAMVPDFAAVVRGGHSLSVPVARLVPGDIVMLASGDRVPADLRLLQVRNFRVDESALTGESASIEKSTDAVSAATPLADRTSMAYSGALVTYGTARGVVVATGSATEIGRVSELIAQATDIQTPLTRALGEIARVITLGIGAMCALMLAIGQYRAMSAGLGFVAALQETLIFGIALVVGAIPEGLPAIVTIALAVGVRRMARRQAIIRNLPAVETLGSTTVICSDKTGTLTRNEMTVREVWTEASGSCRVDGTGYNPTGLFSGPDQAWGKAPPDAAQALELASLCNDAELMSDQGRWTILGDPTEGALLAAAAKASIDIAASRKRHRRIDAIPFESEHRFMATANAWQDGREIIIVKGAPEVILPRLRCLELRRRAAEQTERITSQGMRVLLVAHKLREDPEGILRLDDVSGGLEFDALVGIIDPARAEAIEAIARCRAAGIRVKMITGDHPRTAAAVARELALGSTSVVVTGADLDGMTDSDLAEAAHSACVFARVSPEHKLHLVRALQARGEVIAMTGDGVNDAPALRQANIGVAMGITGTSVSKEAADMVLFDDNFATIVAAIEEGRRVYDNLVKSLAFVLPTNLALACIMIVALLFFPFDASRQLLLLPIAPVQLLWINLVTAVTLALPLAFEAAEPDIMKRPPRPPDAPILSRALLVRTAVAAALMTLSVVWVFRWELSKYLSIGDAPAHALAEAQTMAVTTCIAFQIAYLWGSRSLRERIRSIGVFSNPWVFVGVFMVVSLQAMFVYAPALQRLFRSAPLALSDLLLCLAVGGLALPAMALEKMLSQRFGAPRTRDLGLDPRTRHGP